ncbi:septal ring lytic transglycosylase RlpA family protein [Curvivirga aplysinae]|uniref:septal ring lytic transglycosylase RlpA family protein n=1 Tax=Curvivirga aplysinae TaxID=2529852 RepID=UPI0012BD1827|nr:septal ring lytic transglycosylase RlpA family protein [Curvivirga aplysinae]MTI10045.1 septal ring lytic transglycosylase RlpA family protein [Curvivirga aplysinae]
MSFKLSFKSTRISLVLISSMLSLTACSEIQFLSQASKTISTNDSSGGGPVLGGPEHGTNGTHYKVGNAYKIKGNWYYPKEDYAYSEQGVASWYGPNFHNKKTANGAIFDMNKVSAAHKTLPLPSVVRVTNLENGRSLKVKVNDRGPYAHDRIIDMSKRAAQLLGFEKQGTALVKVEILEAESRLLASYMRGDVKDGELPPKPVASPTVAISTETLIEENGVETSIPTPSENNVSVATIVSTPVPTSVKTETLEIPQDEAKVENVVVGFVPGIYVQAGAFSQYANAVKTQARLSSIGEVVIQQVNKGENPLFRVRVGPIETVTKADNIQSAIVNAGYPDARIVVEAKN